MLINYIYHILINDAYILFIFDIFIIIIVYIMNNKIKAYDGYNFKND